MQHSECSAWEWRQDCAVLTGFIAPTLKCSLLECVVAGGGHMARHYSNLDLSKERGCIMQSACWRWRQIAVSSGVTRYSLVVVFNVGRQLVTYFLPDCTTSLPARRLFLHWRFPLLSRRTAVSKPFLSLRLRQSRKVSHHPRNLRGYVLSAG
jgi:hypothetical protein